MRLTGAAVVVLCGVGGLVLAGQANPMRPGQWEITTQMEMPNMPMKMPETKMTQCVTAEQLKDPTAAMSGGGPGGKPNSACKISDYKTSGGTVSWKMACPPPQAVDGTAEMTFKDDSYTGKMNMKTDKGTMTMKVAGKRLGDCK
jgi:Protein of unknown function (DUF3617)